eukprot:8049701-Lingulodinium_polyedra.AAC.1
MHSSVAEFHCGAAGRGIGPLHGDTSQVPSYCQSHVHHTCQSSSINTSIPIAYQSMSITR